mmetsp:Transcript_61458/g.181635  ORF Transcript_61458/g.181635 Transcript_61458/m.181635 type:complete len:197 (-) Transcript_61458:1224-1814(-)
MHIKSHHEDVGTLLHLYMICKVFPQPSCNSKCYLASRGRNTARGTMSNFDYFFSASTLCVIMLMLSSLRYAPQYLQLEHLVAWDFTCKGHVIFQLESISKLLQANLLGLVPLDNFLHSKYLSETCKLTRSIVVPGKNASLPNFTPALGIIQTIHNRPCLLPCRSSSGLTAQTAGRLQCFFFYLVINEFNVSFIRGF